MQNEFFEMIKDSIIDDYYTPGIKAEVTIEMLLSTFIEDIVTSAVHKHSENKENVHLLAKEFPLVIGNKGNSNCKVDFLMGNTKILYLVEVKTTDKFNEKQFHRYLEKAKEPEKLIDNFQKILRKSIDYKEDTGLSVEDVLEKKNNPDKEEIITILKSIKSSKYKYLKSAYTLREGVNVIKGSDVSIDDYWKEIEEVKIIYISPSGVIPKSRNDLLNITLRKPDERAENVFPITKVVVKEGKEELWKQVLSIINDIFK